MDWEKGRTFRYICPPARASVKSPRQMSHVLERIREEYREMRRKRSLPMAEARASERITAVSRQPERRRKRPDDELRRQREEMKRRWESAQHARSRQAGEERDGPRAREGGLNPVQRLVSGTVPGGN